MKHIAGCFTFFPEALFGSAPKNNLPILKRLLHRFTIHKTDHQDRAVTGILNNCRNNAVEFIEL